MTKTKAAARVAEQSIIDLFASSVGASTLAAQAIAIGKASTHPSRLGAPIVESDDDNDDDGRGEEDGDSGEDDEQNEHGKKRKKSDVPLTGAALRLENRKKHQEYKEQNKLKDPRTIFVGNIPIETKEKELKRFFSQFGEIESARFRSIATKNLAADAQRKGAVLAGKLREGVLHKNAYILFRDEDSVTKSLAMHGREWNGRHLRVDRVGDEYEKSFNQRLSIFVGNLPLECDEEALFQFFCERCPEATSVRTVRDKTTLIGKGFGFVSFKNIDGVNAALKLDGESFGGRALRITRSTPQKGSKPGFDRKRPRTESSDSSKRPRTDSHEDPSSARGDKKSYSSKWPENSKSAKTPSKKKQIHILTAQAKSLERKKAGKLLRKERRRLEREAKEASEK